MTRVALGLGSNIDPHIHLPAGLKLLAKAFPDMVISPVYISNSLGFNGNCFWNLVAIFTTDFNLLQLTRQLRNIEYANGRAEFSPKYSNRTLDIDLLLFGDWVGEIEGVLLPREDVLKHAFVLRPLQDVAPYFIHPKMQKNYQTLWAEFAQETHDLWSLPVEQQKLFAEFNAVSFAE